MMYSEHATPKIQEQRNFV